jgi:hypothetical protein
MPFDSMPFDSMPFASMPFDSMPFASGPGGPRPFAPKAFAPRPSAAGLPGRCEACALETAALTLGEATPDAEVDLLLQGILEARFLDGTPLTEANRGLRMRGAPDEERLRVDAPASGPLGPISIVHVSLPVGGPRTSFEVAGDRTARRGSAP